MLSALEGVPKSDGRIDIFWDPTSWPGDNRDPTWMSNDAENPPPMHGALVQSRSSKDGSRWKQMEAMGGRPFESDRQLEMDHGTFFLTCTADSVRHRAAPCGMLHPSPIWSKAIQSDEAPRLLAWSSHGNSTAGTSNMINLISLISCDTVRHHQRAKTSYETSRNSQSLVSQLHHLNGSGHITWIFCLHMCMYVDRICHEDN